MDTKRIYIDIDNLDLSDLQEAASLLQDGQLVAFPTETVYGLGANALDAAACQKIFEVKGRPQDNPLIVHIANQQMAEPLIKTWSQHALVCMEKFWPGPLTLVLPKTDWVPDQVTGGLDTLALRMPRHTVALALIEQAGIPVAAPSANLSGKPSPTTGSHVWADLKGRIPLLLDAGRCNVGLESTVLDVSGEIPVILRPGGVTREQLESVLGEVKVDQPSENQSPKAPGMKYRHYAPQGEMFLVTGTREKVLNYISEKIYRLHMKRKRVGILCTLESAPLLQSCSPELMFVLGSENLPEEVAASLFNGLRLCDQQKIDVILAEGIAEKGLGSAIMNRLTKAAGQKIINV